MRYRKYRRVSIVVMIFLFFFISIGYSYLNVSLNINGEITIKPNIDARYLYDEIAFENKVNSGSNVIDNQASTYVTSTSGINFYNAPSDTNGKGVYIRSGTENNEYPIYYYRGVVTNNNVIFAGFCWKIVRTTETGGIKIIYNGLPTDGVCNNTGSSSQIGTSPFNYSGSSINDVGYMFGTRYSTSQKSMSKSNKYVYGNDVEYTNGSYVLNDTYTSSGWANDYGTIQTKYHYTCFSSKSSCSSVYYVYFSYDENTAYYVTLENGKKIDDFFLEMFPESNDERNVNDSAIKTKIDAWYKENMVTYTDMLEDTIWCNDRSIYRKGGFDKDTAASYNSYLSFGAMGRVANGSNFKPSVTCPQQVDSFTVNNEVGNKKLTYPVGLITPDEATLAGNGWKGFSTSAYLYTGNSWYTMSHYGYMYDMALFLAVDDDLTNGVVSNSLGIRPSVSLLLDTIVLSGNGLPESPFVIYEKI